MKTLSLVFWCVAVPMVIATSLNFNVFGTMAVVGVAVLIAACE